jgi:NADP oxidoreductase coenzyme F420-dependent
MKIAIWGAGNVGSALGKGWAAKGHSIYFGVPEPQSEKMGALVRSIGNPERGKRLEPCCRDGSRRHAVQNGRSAPARARFCSAMTFERRAIMPPFVEQKFAESSSLNQSPKRPRRQR